MTRIGLLSDTHGYMDASILHYLDEVDEIWHAGDIGALSVMEALEAHKPVVGVYGNIDGAEARLRYPEMQIKVRGGVRMLMMHIGGRPGRYSKKSLDAIREHRPDVFICGHSHITLVKNDPSYNLMHMNPGACGRHGFHKMRTLLRFSAVDGKLEDLELIELGPRSAHPTSSPNL